MRWSSMVALPIAIACASAADAWLVGFPHPGSGSATAVPSIATDATGNIYAAVNAGSVITGSQPTDVAVKLDSDGNVLWRYASAAAPHGDELALDGLGDVLVISGFHATLTKLDGPDGTVLWQVTSVGSTRLHGIVADGAGDVYVSITGGADPDFIVAKLSGANGSELWRYSEDVGPDDAAAGLVRMPDGNVGAGGRVGDAGLGTVTGIVVKVDASTGAPLWRVEPTAPPGEQVDIFHVAGLSTDVVIGGAIGADAGIIRLDGATGGEVWRYLGGPSIVWAMAVGSGGEIAIRRTEILGLNTVIPFIERIDGDTGTQLWSLSRDAAALAVTSEGDIVLGGDGPSYNLPVQYVFSATELDGTSGQERWRTSLNGSDALGSETVSAVAVAPGGSILVGGTFENGTTRADPTIVSVDDRLATRKLVLKDKATDPSKQRLVWKSVDRLTGGNRAGEVDDPTSAGATLKVANPISGETLTIPLPAANWQTREDRREHVYADPLGLDGPCRKAAISVGRYVLVKCKGVGSSLTLDEPSQGDVAITLSVPGGMRYCGRVGGASIVRDFVSSSGAGTLLAKNAPRPTTCVATGP